MRHLYAALSLSSPSLALAHPGHFEPSCLGAAVLVAVVLLAIFGRRHALR